MSLPEEENDDNKVFYIKYIEPSEYIPEMTVLLYDGLSLWEEEQMMREEMGEFDLETDEPPKALDSSSLREALQNNVPQGTSSLMVDCDDGIWSAVLDDEQWTDACKAVAEGLPNLQNVQIAMTENLKDKHLAKFLEKLPQIGKLELTHVGDCPLALAQLGISLEHVQELMLMDERYPRNNSKGLSLASCQKLASSLHQMKSLKKLTLSDLVVQKPKESWNMLLDAIRRLDKLETLNLNGGWYKTEPQLSEDENIEAAMTAHRFTISEATKEAARFGPRLNDIKRKYLSQLNGQNLTLDDWITAISCARDQFDCAHYLLREMDPNLYTNSVLQQT